MRLLVLVLALVVQVSPSAVRASEADVDPDTEVAKDHFQKGRDYYAARQYEQALNEFEMARRVKPLPAFDYNIARCHDRLAHYADALEWYRRYVAHLPTPADAADVRARITVLEERVADKPPPPLIDKPPPAEKTNASSVPRAPSGVPAATGKQHRLVAPLTVAGMTLGVAIMGIGLVASVAPDYDRLRQQQLADPGAMLQIPARELEDRLIGGYVCLAAAGVLAVVDIALFATMGRRAEPLRAMLGGRF